MTHCAYLPLLAAAALCMACGPSASRPDPRVADAPTTGGAASDPSGDGAPADFSVQAGGGPVAIDTLEETTDTEYRIEPRAGEPGAFDLVATTTTYGASPMPPATQAQVERVPIPADRVAVLFRIFTARRAELDAPCDDPNIMDGASSSFTVRAHGEEASFRCTNASTPAFDELSEAFYQLVRDFAPTPE